MPDLARLKQMLDSRWYVARHPEAASNPLDHFMTVGLAAGLDPNPMFDAAWYAGRYPDAVVSGRSALASYLDGGAALGHDPGPLFDTQWYLSRNPDVASAGADPLDHYLVYGSHELRDPSPIFDSPWYFANHPAARAPGLDACTHYIAEGHALGYSPSAFFDTQWYREAYAEVAASGEDPLLHYLLRGAALGYNPGPYFDTQAYVAGNPDCALSGKNPLVHFLLDEERRRLAWAKTESRDALPPGREAIGQIDALVRLLSGLEVDLQRMAGTTALLPVQAPGQHDILQRWRALYLSLSVAPRAIVLVGSIDDTPGLADLAAMAGDMLILETDTVTASTAEGLPRGSHWRALAEFGPPLDLDSCVTVATALVNNLQPDAVLVWGSRVGWEVIARHGGALRHKIRLFATGAAIAHATDPDPLKSYFRSALPWLTGLYNSDMTHAAHMADLFGLPQGQREKILGFDDLTKAGGFLSNHGEAGP